MSQNRGGIDLRQHKGEISITALVRLTGILPNQTLYQLDAGSFPIQFHYKPTTFIIMVGAGLG